MLFNSLIITAALLLQTPTSSTHYQPVTPPVGKYHLQYAPVADVSGTMYMTIQAPNAQLSKALVWAPELDNSPTQQNCWTKLELGSSIPTEVTEISPYQQNFLIAEMPVNSRSFNAQYQFGCTLWSCKLVQGSSSSGLVPELTRDVRKRFTASMNMTDYANMTSWITQHDLWAHQGEDTINFVLRMISILKKQGIYKLGLTYPDYHASSLVKNDYITTDCGGWSTVATAVLRANGIPAYLVGGILAQSANGQDTHCRTMFWVDGIGWIPLEMTYSLSMPDSQDFSCFQSLGDLIITHIGTNTKVKCDLGYLTDQITTRSWWAGSWSSGNLDNSTVLNQVTVTKSSPTVAKN